MWFKKCSLLLIWFIQCFVSMITAGYINMIFVTVQLDVSQNLWGGFLAWCAQQLQSTKWLPFHLNQWCIWHQMEALFLCPFQQHTLDQHQSWLAFCLLSGEKAWYVRAKERKDIHPVLPFSWANQQNSHFFAPDFNIVYTSVSVSFKYILLSRLLSYFRLYKNASLKANNFVLLQVWIHRKRTGYKEIKRCRYNIMKDNIICHPFSQNYSFDIFDFSNNSFSKNFFFLTRNQLFCSKWCNLNCFRLLTWRSVCQMCCPHPLGSSSTAMVGVL